MKDKHNNCDSCVATMIQGVYCHEQGCPEAWRDQTYECKFCGEAFKSKNQHTILCCDECVEAYYG